MRAQHHIHTRGRGKRAMKKIDISLFLLSHCRLCQTHSEDTLSTYPLFSSPRHLTNIVFLPQAHCSSRSFYFIDLFFISRVVEQHGRARESRKKGREQRGTGGREGGKRENRGPMHFFLSFPITPFGGYCHRSRPSLPLSLIDTQSRLMD